MNKHCSLCGKIWTQNSDTGICQWCHRPASGISRTAKKSRSIRSKGSRPDNSEEQAIKRASYQALEGEYAHYYQIASRYSKMALPDDRDDLLHDIIEKLAGVQRDHDYSEPALYRIASHVKDDYWRKHYSLTSGLDCKHCNREQRQKCKDSLYDYSECPKLIRVERLNREVTDSEGNITEYGELIADDSALDLPEWCSINEMLLHSPARLIEIAEKRLQGETLTDNERLYLFRYRKKLQAQMF